MIYYLKQTTWNHLCKHLHDSKKGKKNIYGSHSILKSTQAWWWKWFV